ncbi:MFS transporter [Gallaecimonas xiamenensis]|uniref:Major facilitator superfamily protein n=1 Tax=Gallaecimonas xiamenensis 3-C-1 TaxID=745411 RepID=K2K486_9GAMM|nr:MFS transporter [Gallaecimonas xiamenensis]EKE72230.1 major facilitator superfamily protein [Gallaecimonas xiamenensis 3-C-1]
MSGPQTATNDTALSGTGGWPAVWSIAMGVFALVTAEFLPASLLTPMGEALGVSAGQMGQAVTVTALMALLGGLAIVPLTKGIDRRRVMVALSGLMLVSNLAVALAPNLWVLLAARIGLGLALGGFWAIAAATTIRLVSERQAPKALSLIFSGVPLATITAAGLGSYLGGLWGWREVFAMATLLSALTMAAQWMLLPPLTAQAGGSMAGLWAVLKRPGLGLGIGVVTLIFTAHFAGFTYLRDYLEHQQLGLQVISLVLLGFGLANFCGTLLAGRLIGRYLPKVLLGATVALLMALLLLGLLDQGSALLGLVMIVLWGLAFGGTPVSWSTWVTQVVPDQTESGGALIVSAIQLAIALGALMGGVIVDTSGAGAVMLASGLVLLVATLILVASRRRLH